MLTAFEDQRDEPDEYEDERAVPTKNFVRLINRN